MVARSSLFIVVSLLFLIGAASALPDLMVISSDKSEVGIIANNFDTATITVLLYEGSTPVSDIQVNFTVINPVMGTINPATIMTGADGRATAIFTAGIQPGNAEIRADSATLFNTTSQVIVAPIPDDTSHIESPVEWLIANGSDKATISVYAYNSSPSFSNYPISGLQVQFSVNNSIFGTFSPVTTVTNSDGLAQSTFTTKTKSGTALIYGNITYRIGDVSYVKSVEPYAQKIDHDTPYRISDYNYSYRVDVGEITPLAFNFTDRWQNPIDNRRIAEEVNFTVSSPSLLPKGAGFLDGSDYVRSKKFAVDSEGYVRGDLKVDEVPGWNYITIHPLMYDASGNQAFTDKSLIIEGIPGKPVRIEAAFTPADFRQPADGVSVFDITYTLWDKYDNFVQNRSVMVETSIPGEGKIVGTSPQGQAVLHYGPKWSIGMVQITATALDNTSVTHTQQIWFVPQEPVDVLFTASPQTMPSLDVPNRDSTWLIATIVDESGNPIEESVEVTFGFNGVTYDNSTYNITDDPEIPTPVAMTNEDGVAMVEFLPGGFSTTNQKPSTGRCNVTATWGGVTRSIPVVWKNYPYLSVEAYASKNLVEVNDTVDITVLLKGDGYKLLPPPIDVILCTDRSGSMLYDDPDRMHSIREAAKVFVDQFSTSRDRIGIVTFGRNGYISRPGYNSGISLSEIDNTYNPYSRTYNGYATYDRVLTNNFLDVKTQLDRILPDHGTPMREATRLSTRTLITSGRSNAVKAVVLLSDGDYNWYGDPLARGSSRSWDPSEFGDLTQYYYYYSSLNSSNQNMSNYARNNNIKIYSIAFADTISVGGKQTLQTLALATGGKYYEASATDIEDVYLAIAGDLKTDAGVNTEMDLDYENILVNYTVYEVNDESNPIFKYNYSSGNSTWLDTYFTDNTPISLPGIPGTYDNTSQWEATKRLEFFLGTVRLYQVWEIRYRLVAQKEGLFNLFGPESQITFEEADEPLSLPDLVLKVNPKISDTPVESTELYYTQIEQSQGSADPDFYIVFNITHTYTGTHDVREDYYIVTYDGRRYYMGSAILTPEQSGQQHQFQILLSQLPAGWTRLEPVLTELGWEAPGPIIPAQPIPVIQQVVDPNKQYINLT